ncbi:hypothetical protein ACFL6G_08245 [candidate division KSB1 bacterium]
MRKSVIIVILLILTVTNSCTSRQTYTEELIDGVRYVHNIEPLWGDKPEVVLGFIRKYGDLETNDERYQLFHPSDAAVDEEGNVLILDAGNYKIKKFDREGNFLSYFGSKGSGPGELIGPSRMDICPGGEILINDRAVRAVNIFDRNGNFIRRINNEGLSPDQILDLRSGEIAVFYKRTFHSEKDKEALSLVNILDKNGMIHREFVAPRIYEDPPTIFWCNSIWITGDDLDNIYVDFESQNRIEKYSPNGRLLFKADRLLEYPETLVIEKKVTSYDRNGQPELVALAFNIFTTGIQIDSEGRIWSGTLKKQRDPEDKQERKEGGKPENYMFEIFDENGILLGRLQTDFYLGQHFRIIGDRLFLIDRDREMAVFEYRIIEK